ncbi:MAG: AGE family epimerase/isomerase [Muribaculaceae bacterium]|nr:AGE family epimerase/isomerase [Muribaculaceae bacterium]
MNRLCLAAMALAPLFGFGQRIMLDSNLLDKAELRVSDGVVSDAGLLRDYDCNTVTRLYKGDNDPSVEAIFKDAVAMRGINLVAGGDLGLAPSKLTVYGRNTDDESWTQIGRQLSASFPYPYTNTLVRTANTKSYSQYKVSFALSSGAQCVELNEIQFLGLSSEPQRLTVDGNGRFLTSDGDVHYGGYGDAVSVTKQRVDNGVMDEEAWQAWIEYDFDVPTSVTSYSLGGDAFASRKNRPAVWELLGSDDGINWVSLDLRVNEPQVECEDYATQYVPGVSGVYIDFNAVANDILSTIDKKFYRDYYDGKYLIDTWNKDETKCNTGYNYWWMAHAIDAYVDAYRRSNLRQHELHARAIRTGMYTAYDPGRHDLWNSYYDDMEWMCLACLRASETFSMGASTWLDEARQLFDWIWAGWDETTGGILWNSESQRGVIDSKNSCSNGPAMIAAALLYQKTGEEHYLEKAVKIFEFMNAHNLFDDGFVKDGPTNNNRGWTFTYNQGTWVGGLLELYRVTGDTKYRDIATELIDKSIDSRWYSPYGVMGESGKGDGGLFKGIYVRYITEWVLSGLLDADRQRRYASYLVENARSLCLSALVRPDMTVLANWRDRAEASSDEYCASVLLSGLFLVESVNRMQAAGILTNRYAVVNPEVQRPFSRYRLVTNQNFGGGNVDFCSFDLFGEEETGVDDITDDPRPSQCDDAWYTVTGMRVTKPSSPGFYIHQGHKILIPNQ